METLPDYLAPGLRLLSIGLNPSLPSVAAGFYFANPRNRFWSALNASRLVSEALVPGAAAVQALFEAQRIGFTDLVKRATRGGSALRQADFRPGAERLQRLLENFQPDIAWFHGKVAYKQFVRHAGVVHDSDEWGLQAVRIGATRCFVTPNPSPANAVFSLQDLVGWYNRLADQLKVEEGSAGAAHAASGVVGNVK
jgi:TDG/mug DNA glycosylase family protein